MPVFLFALLLILGMIALVVLMLPFSILMRYRAGSARRRARGWVTTLNLALSLISAGLLLLTAAVSNVWIPNSLLYTGYGFGIGALLGCLGLVLTRWEPTGRGLYYTPSRLLILSITLVVSARIFYSFWRGWHAWQTTPEEESWLAVSGAAGSMGAGAAVLAYYVVYWIGVRWKLRRS